MNYEEQRQEFMEVMLPQYKNRQDILNYAGNQTAYKMLRNGLSREEVAEQGRISEERLGKLIDGQTFWTSEEVGKIGCWLNFDDIGKLIPIDYRKLEEKGEEILERVHGQGIPKIKGINVLAIAPLLPELYLVDK